ncbi:MAG: flagellin [Parvularculaceae bacterium]|jgi:flagellin|nr:flagellin [Parvularculaceae bacterium]
MISVSTNPGALIALQNLTRVTDSLAETQRRVSTGLQVSSAKDNPAIYALAQQQRAQLASLETVQQGLRVGVSTVDVALAAGESISDVLVEMRQLASQAADSQLSANDRQLLQDRYADLADQITRLVDSANIGGRNLIASGAADMTVIASDDGSSTITVAAQDLSIGGGIINVSADGSALSSSGGAQTELANIIASIDALSSALGALGGGGKALTLQDRILNRVSDAVEISIGNLVDADLARESSRLQALQVQQQLAIQTLSIANAAPNSILALFA